MPFPSADTSAADAVRFSTALRRCANRLRHDGMLSSELIRANITA